MTFTFAREHPGGAEDRCLIPGGAESREIDDAGLVLGDAVPAFHLRQIAS